MALLRRATAPDAVALIAVVDAEDRRDWIMP